MTGRSVVTKIMKATQKLDKCLVEDVVKNTDNFLFDCDGVLWRGTDPVPGCREAIQKLHDMGKRIFYVTNNSSKTRQQVVDKCIKMGYPAKTEHILGTAYSSAQYLKSIGFQGKLYMVGNPSMAEELDKCGIQHTGLGPDIPPESCKTLYEIIDHVEKWQPDPEVKAVLVGFDPHHNYQKMTKAATYAHNKDILFLATNEDKILPQNGHLVIPGTGSIVTSVKTPAMREPLIVGKPNTIMFDLLHEAHVLEPERSIMVGDSLFTDIAMASHCGMKSLLVLTGVDNLESIEKQKNSGDADKESRIPNFYVESFGKFGELMQEST